MKEAIKNYYKQHVRAEDRLLFTLTGVLFLLGLSLLLINALTNNFQGNVYIPPTWFYFLPAVLGVLLLGMYAIHISPRTALAARAYGTYFFIFLAGSTFSTGLQFTPFPTIDHLLVNIDQALHFSTPALLSWTHFHSFIHDLFILAYSSLYPELLSIPIILALLLERKQIDRFMLIAVISFIIGGLIYYFLPTIAPAGLIHSPYFISQEHDTALKFYEIHHHLKITTWQGGLIAFPSFHVIWAVMMSYTCRIRKWLFYPALVINTLLILSTMFLGWHYLTDVIAGIIVAVISILIAEYLLKKSELTLQCRSDQGTQ